MESLNTTDDSDEVHNEATEASSEQAIEVQKNILWPNIKAFYEQQKDNAVDKKGNVSFQCILCKPKIKFLSTSTTSNSNLRTHIKVIFF